MTRLNCSVNQCANYSEGCCCRPNIKVSGSNAHRCDETCCSSFMKDGNAATNSATACHRPNMTSDIACSAKNCIHYKDNKCCADAVMVQGAGASCQKDTECGSFCCR